MQVLSRRSPYEDYVRCTRCGVWLRKTELRLNKIGLPICPECGRNVRTKARKKNHKSRVMITQVEFS